MINIDDVIRVCQDHEYPYRIKGPEPKLLLIGEEKTDEDIEEYYLDVQEKIIRLIQPTLILHEKAYPLLNNSDDAPESKRIAHWGGNYNIPVRLCNIPKKNKLTTRNTIENIVSSILEGLEFQGNGETYAALNSTLNTIEENYKAHLIIRGIEKGNIPLMAVVSSTNIRPRSYIHQALKKNDIDYITIAQDKEMIENLTQNASFFGSYNSKDKNQNPETD